MMRRVLIVFCSILLVLAAPQTQTAATQELDPDYVRWSLDQFPPELRREVEALRHVLTPGELKEFLSLTTEHSRRPWIEDYWSLRDPVFTTEENEKRIEHNRRVAFAESHFFVPKFPMWDQRGEVYIRYGPPAFRQIIPPQISPAGYRRPGELWFYSQHDMYVLFEDAVGTGEYTYYLERVQGPPNLRMDRIDPIDKLMGAVPPLPSAHAAHQYESFQKRVHRFQEVLSKTPASYPYDFEDNRLPFVFGVDQFRGGEWVDRVDVNVEFVADVDRGTSRTNTKEYKATAVFWDTERNEVGRREQNVELPLVEGAVDSTRLMPIQLVFSLSPGFYHMAVTVEERNTGKLASYRSDVTCVDFESKIAISDIVFASKIAPTTRVSPFNRGPLEVVPHPSRSYRRSESIPVYFEVYNLSVGEGNRASYTVEYEVRPLPTGQAGYRERPSTVDMSSSFSATWHGPRDVVHLSIDSQYLWEGEFEFRITITDELLNTVNSREAAFRIVE
ncbi:MAG: GWxTD domain-containing protein [Candidatus Latescibacterota bacterium]|nr:MAG: GWxTD domain-containing protein [Candidatus Latescibacterota bacterium]